MSWGWVGSCISAGLGGHRRGDACWPAPSERGWKVGGGQPEREGAVPWGGHPGGNSTRKGECTSRVPFRRAVAGVRMMAGRGAARGQAPGGGFAVARKAFKGQVTLLRLCPFWLWRVCTACSAFRGALGCGNCPGRGVGLYCRRRKTECH